MLAKATARSEETVGFCFYSTTCHCVWSGLTECLSSRSLWTALFASYGGPFAFAACLKLPQRPLLRKFLQYRASLHRQIPAPHPSRGVLLCQPQVLFLHMSFFCWK